jgi:hypothetical protein
MKNPNTFLAKDGVSDADLVRAARDMYEALEAVMSAVGAKGDRQYAALSKGAKALAKARGEI